jgi:GTP-binding protein EngB required for normal cell division
MAVRSMSGRVAAVCEEVAAAAREPAFRQEVEHIKDSVLEPVRVAIVGRVSSGKSTLVNALLGRRVAPTDVSECTKVVTRFRFGHPERVAVVAVGGAVRTLSLRPDGLLPDLGVDVDAIDHLEVHLSDERLQTMTIIDTPGLASSVERRTEAGELLQVDARSRAALRDADAVLLMVSESARREDVALLAAFRDLFSGIRASAINAVGVLTKVDKLGDDDADPWAVANRVAANLTKALAPFVSAVVPVIGLLAETSTSLDFTEDEAASLRVLAAAPKKTRTRLLLSVEAFRKASIDVDADGRERLLRLLDLHGVGVAIAAIEAGAAGASDLAAHFRTYSHLADIEGVIQRVFRRGGDVIKADWAVAALTRVAGAPGDEAGAAELLRNRLEGLGLLPEMHRIAEVAVLHDVVSGALAVPDPLRPDVEKMALGGSLPSRLGLEPAATASELREAALAGATRWRRYMNDPRAGRAESKAAAVMCRSFALLVSEIA